jgi:thiol-disulfide isomerase/thioredoxin
MKYLMMLILLITGCQNVFPQLKSGWYRAVISREDGAQIVFNFESLAKGSKTVLDIRNAAERIAVDEVIYQNDSVFVNMPFFESWFRLKVNQNNSLTGIWIKGTSNKNIQLPVTVEYSKKERFAATGKPLQNISGRWQVNITRPNGAERPAIAEFQQKGSYLTGTFLTPSGDYRYLEGVVSNDTLRLSCFDGSHAYSFTAQIQNNTIVNGYFYSSASAPEKWKAEKNTNAVLPDSIQRAELKPGETKLNFSFTDVNGNIVSINDACFQNKVVVVQLMGSWCPNCMDESKFLGSFYKAYKNRGVEIVALAYELSTDVNRSKQSLQKFISRFDIQYPVLIAPAAVNDEKRTEKTLPQLTSIRAFPTTIFIDRKGNVHKIHQGFYGPGTGEHYTAFKNEFYSTVQALLQN